MFQNKNQAGCLNLGQAGWKYYNTIRKKAVEQEFSWSGLLISLSIAFFVVIVSASILNFINRSIASAEASGQLIKEKNIYFLENNVYLSGDLNQTIEKFIT